MNLKRILLRYFLPFFLSFATLSVLSLNGSFQKVIYPFFENFAITALNNDFEDTYFKAKPKGPTTDLNYNNISVLFQSKRTLTAIMEEARRTNSRASYDYLGFNITVDETFVAPLIFFLCLLLFSPGSWKNKAIAFVLGSLLILGFSYLIIHFKGLYMVSKSGVRDLAYNENDINFFQFLHFFFSGITIVTVVLLTWILVAFRKSDLVKFMEQYK
ncbi:MAG: hypothetical protein AAF960_07595 [Bacteroidota bacterium]